MRWQDRHAGLAALDSGVYYEPRCRYCGEVFPSHSPVMCDRARYYREHGIGGLPAGRKSMAGAGAAVAPQPRPCGKSCHCGRCRAKAAPARPLLRRKSMGGDDAAVMRLLERELAEARRQYDEAVEEVLLPEVLGEMLAHAEAQHDAVVELAEGGYFDED